MNLEVAAGWLQYAGMKKIHPYHIDGEASVRIHESCCELAEKSAAHFAPQVNLKANCGECWLEKGGFAGRFLAVKLSDVWAGGGYAVAVSVHTPGGDRRAGAVLLHSLPQLRCLAEDIGRAMTLPHPARTESIRAAIKKWEGKNPLGFENKFTARPNMFSRFTLGCFGLFRKVKEAVNR